LEYRIDRKPAPLLTSAIGLASRQAVRYSPTAFFASSSASAGVAGFFGSVIFTRAW